MSISDKTRKILWGRSGSLCAICKCTLIHDGTAKDSESVVGDECHIVSPETNGPRNDRSTEQFDIYGNLILLCKVHHKLVDDQFQTFTSEILKGIKHNHEKWVADHLSKTTKGTQSDTQEDTPESIEFLSRLNSGKEIMNIVGGAYQFGMSHDEPKNEDEMNLIASFMQEVQDYGDLYSDLEAGARVEASYHLSQLLARMEAAGFWVFGLRENKRMKFSNGSVSLWPTATIQVFRSDNPTIIKLDLRDLDEEKDDG